MVLMVGLDAIGTVSFGGGLVCFLRWMAGGSNFFGGEARIHCDLCGGDGLGVTVV